MGLDSPRGQTTVHSDMTFLIVPRWHVHWPVSKMYDASKELIGIIDRDFGTSYIFTGWAQDVA